MTPTEAKIKLEELKDICACYERSIDRIESRLEEAQLDIVFLEMYTNGDTQELLAIGDTVHVQHVGQEAYVGTIKQVVSPSYLAVQPWYGGDSQWVCLRHATLTLLQERLADNE